MPANTFVQLPDSLFQRWSRFFELRKSRLPFLERMVQLGDLVQGHVGPNRVCYVNHPELIREVLMSHTSVLEKGMILQRAKRLFGNGLLTSEGDLHKRQRRLLQPAFQRQRLALYGEVMIDCAERYAKSLGAGEIRSMDHDLSRVTLAIVASTLFHRSVDQYADEISHHLTTFMRLLPYYSLPLASMLEKVPGSSLHQGRQAIDAIDAIVRRLVDERRSLTTSHDDLLSMMIRAQDTDGGGMSDQQLRDECLTLLLAGHETTCNALLWTLYCLARNPDVEARVQAELDQVLAGRAPMASDLPQLLLLERVFAESMRLYPPVWIIARRAIAAFSLAGQTIERGTLVAMSQWGVHHDPRWYPAPYHFDPERFNEAGKAARPRFAYFPFSGGARGCIGEGFAWMEGVAVLACLVRRWKFRLATDETVEPEPLMTLRPRLTILHISPRQ